MTDLGIPRLDGTTTIVGAIDSTASSIEIDTLDWAVDAGDYPLLFLIDGELIQATTATAGGSTITLNAVTRSLNSVTKSHDAGTIIEVAHPFILALGHAVPAGVPAGTVVPPDPPPPGPGAHTVQFRTTTDTPTLAEIEHPSGGTIYAGGAGTTYGVTSESEWNTAVAAATPGDIIKITAAITTPLTYRGAKYGIAGGSAANGAAGNPIVLACEGSGAINIASTTNSDGAIDVLNVDHIWGIELDITGSQFGARWWNCEGTAANPIRIAHSSITDTGHAALDLKGWFQAITSSGGTPPAGSGNEWGFAKHVLIDSNTISRPGRSSTSTGENIYLGYGSSPSWISHADYITIARNTLTESTSDYLDIKPGCSNIAVYDNVMYGGSFVSGAAMQVLYVDGSVADRPSWYDFDPNIRIEANRIYDGNITGFDASSSNYVVQASLAGITFANNLCWGFPNGAIMFRLRSEKAASQSQSTDGEKWVVYNNTGWVDNGLANAGAPAASPSPFSGALIDSRNNLGPSGASGFEFTGTAADFIDSAAIPTVDTIDADAIWETYGAGSAFDLASDTSLAETGSDISDLVSDLAISADISQRTIPATAPNPGCFQPA